MATPGLVLRRTIVVRTDASAEQRCDVDDALHRVAQLEAVFHHQVLQEAVRVGLADVLESLLGLDHADVLRYSDAERGQRRSVRLLAHDAAGPTAGARVQAFLLAGDTQAAGWVSTLLMDELPAQAYGRALLAGTAPPPLAVPSCGVQSCNCFDVSEAEVVTCLASYGGSAEARLAQLQATLKCGTNCGSCLPALRLQVRHSQPVAQAA